MQWIRFQISHISNTALDNFSQMKANNKLKNGKPVALHNLTPASEMTYTVSGGALKSSHSILTAADPTSSSLIA